MHAGLGLGTVQGNLKIKHLNDKCNVWGDGILEDELDICPFQNTEKEKNMQLEEAL